MNSVLQKKLNELQNANDYECWYLVKQPTAFDNLCYLVSFLKEFKTNEVSENLQVFIEKKVREINGSKPDVEISNNYRALRVAAFFGLIIMTSTKYEEAIITETFEEINERCGGEFEKKDLYKDIIQRQIEKMYISSMVDEEHNGVRKDYRLYPVMLLYKVLIELGHSTGNYSISMTEYRYLVATTKRFEEFLETLLLIKLLREDPSAKVDFEHYRTKFDNRLIQALKQLPTLLIDRDYIKLNPNTLSEVAKKVFAFENNPDIFSTENYLRFLGSRKSLFQLEDFENENKLTKHQGVNQIDSDETLRIGNGTNELLYGVPGSGKSFTIDCIVKDSEYERVVFHPDYTYSDFVGQIMPRLKRNADGTEKLTYEFVSGPFTKALKAAVDNEDSMHYLVIEEINRGNAPAIFGDIFQLLDRNEDGSGKYHITNFDIAREVYGDEVAEIRIPSNLSILATMNTSDQNVFTLDTAFQRRWDMKYIENNVAEAEHANEKIEHSDVTWGGFASAVNEEILEYNAELSSFEDKQLGAYFVTKAELTSDKFPEKALKYLWDDAFKLERDKIFRPEIKSVGDLVHSYDVEIQNNRDPIKGIMRAEVYRKMMDMSAYGPEEAIDESEIFEAEINDGE